MISNVEYEMFEVLKGTNIDYKSFHDVVGCVNSLIKDIRGEENAKFYEHSRKLINSINNAGWEERHSAQISYLNEIMGDICDKYEEYLP